VLTGVYGNLPQLGIVKKHLLQLIIHGESVMSLIAGFSAKGLSTLVEYLCQICIQQQEWLH